MANSNLYADDHHWGSQPVNVRAHDLPALKVRYLLDKLPLSGRVLEVGCSSGRVLNTLAVHRPGLELYGCDIRPLRYSPAAFHFERVALDAPALPYEPATFDAVVMMDALEHFADPAGALRAARAVLRPGARLVSFTPLEGQPFSFYRLYRRLLGDDLYVRTKEHIQSFSETRLRRLLDESFEVVDCAYAYHVLGHLMDATLFALLSSSRLRRRFWRDNPYYEEAASSASGHGSDSAFSSALRVANALAYLESRQLRAVRHGAAGILFVALAR